MMPVFGLGHRCGEVAQHNSFWGNGLRKCQKFCLARLFRSQLVK